MTSNRPQNLTQGRSRHAEAESEVKSWKFSHPAGKIKEKRPKDFFSKKEQVGKLSNMRHFDVSSCHNTDFGMRNLILKSESISLLPNPPQMITNPTSKKNVSSFFRLVFSTFWGSSSVVGGWNFDSAYLSISWRRHGVRTMREIEFFQRPFAKTFAIAESPAPCANALTT